MNVDDFRQLLPKLMSEDDSVKAKAKQDYRDLLPQHKLEYLILALRERVDPPEILQLNCILLRRLFWVSVHKQLKKVGVSLKPFKDELISLLKQPLDLNLKKKIAVAAAELDRRLIQSLSEEEEFQWPEFEAYLFECIVSPEVADKEIALSIISCSPNSLNKRLHEDEQFKMLRQFFVHCLSDQTQNIDFRIEAVKSVTAFIQAYNNDEQLIKQLEEVVVHLMNLVEVTLPLEEDHCDIVLKSIHSLVYCGDILKENFDPALQLLVETMLKKEVKECRRRLCLEIIISLAEAMPAIIRKRGKQYLPQIVNHLLLMMTDLDDLAEWTNSAANKEGYDSNVVVSEMSLDGLAAALRGETFLPLVLPIISEMLKNESWKFRHAGLIAFAIIGQGCHDNMLPILSDIVNEILPFLDDEHPKVKHAACHCIGQMAIDFRPAFQEKFHQPIMHKLIVLFSSSDNLRLRAHSAAAMANFLEGCSSFIIQQHIDAIAEKIEQILNVKISEHAEKGMKLLLEQTVFTLSSLVASAQEQFIKYYEKFFPLLKFIIENAVNPELRLLRGKAIECISLIGLAVGKELFVKDAGDIMNLLLRTQTGEELMEADDPQLVYIIASWSRICKILGPEFAPYLPYVMPQIVKIASLKIKVTLLDKEDVADGEKNEKVTCLVSGEKKFKLKTAGLKEKATACQAIVYLARDLKYAFQDYVEETVQIMIPLLNFYFPERIRTAAAECLPYLIEAGKAKGETFVKNMWEFIFPELLKSIQYEPKKDVLIFASLASCIQCVGKDNINEGQINLINITLKKYMEKFFTNESRKQRQSDEHYDDGVEKELIEESKVLSKINEVIHSLFVVFKEAFLPHLKALFVKLASVDRSVAIIHFIICILNDVIQFTDEHSIKCRKLFQEFFGKGLFYTNPKIRQASAYGFGMMGKCGLPEFAEDCADSIPILIKIVQQPDSRSKLNNLASENAISAVAKILQFNNSHLNVDVIIPAWFSWLPAWEAKSELQYIYNFLFMLIENKHPAILGENNSNLLRLLYIFSDLLCRNSVELSSEIGQKIVMFLNELKNNQNLLLKCLEELNDKHPNHVQKLKQILNV